MNAGRRAERRRPPFPLRIVDALGRALERLGWSYATLDEQALCAAACRKTRLSDFGDERFRPLFRQRIRDLQNLFEQLDFVGRLVARVLFVRSTNERGRGSSGTPHRTTASVTTISSSSAWIAPASGSRSPSITGSTGPS